MMALHKSTDVVAILKVASVLLISAVGKQADDVLPSSPTDVRLTSCNDRVAQLQWTYFEGDNNNNTSSSPVVRFIIEYNTSFRPEVWRVAKTQPVPRDRMHQRIAVSPWGNYSFRVIAQSAVWSSRPSDHTTDICSTPPDVPHLNPKDVCAVNRKSRTLTIVWEALPEAEHNGPGFHYLVKWRRHDGTGSLAAAGDFDEQVVGADGASLTVDAQPIYRSFEISVLSVNDVGHAASPPKVTIGYSGEDVPLEVPRNFRLDPGKEVTSTTADFLWDSVNTGPWRMQGFFRGYKIQYWSTKYGRSSMRQHSIIYREPGPCWKQDSGATPRQKRAQANSGHIYSLAPFTIYGAEVVALNARYEGPPSNVIIFMTKEGVPGPVGEIQIRSIPDDNCTEVNWSAPREPNGLIVGYTVLSTAIALKDSTYSEYGEEIQLDGWRTTQLNITGLRPDQKYRVTVWARTRIGNGQERSMDIERLLGTVSTNSVSKTTGSNKRPNTVTWSQLHHGKAVSMRSRQSGAQLSRGTANASNLSLFIVSFGIVTSS